MYAAVCSRPSLIEVGLAAHDEFFLRFQDGLRRHRIGAVAALVVTGARPVGERVHEPGLPLGLPKDCRHRFGRELLPGLVRVPGQQSAHLVGGEVDQSERFGLDVEVAVFTFVQEIPAPPVSSPRRLRPRPGAPPDPGTTA